jgi:solute carrier family 25 phosphate transporter 23/24/25/41
MHGPAIKGQPSLSKEMMRIYREEGVRAFWKGNAVTIVHRLPYSALNFFSYEKYKAVSWPVSAVLHLVVL